MTKTERVVMLGATGAVGAEVLKTLCDDPRITAVTALVRRDIAHMHRKVSAPVVDVLSPASYASHLTGHQAAVCTFGVGQPSKVSQEEYLRIDKDAVIAFAQACRDAGVRHFELLGSVAANPRSSSFYLQSKGALREAIAGMGFDRFSCFQPSMLLTPQNRYGFSQGVMLAFWPLLTPVLAGGLKKYRGIPVETLGRAMAKNLHTSGTGVEILHWPQFMSLSRERIA